MKVFCLDWVYLKRDYLEKTDFDLFPARLAEHFRRDDRDIFESKKPKLNILELVFNSQGLPDWYLTNKYPLFNDRGDVIGLMGTVRPYGDGEKKELKWERDDEIGRAVNHIRNNFRGEISISDLVKVSGISHRKTAPWIRRVVWYCSYAIHNENKN